MIIEKKKFISINGNNFGSLFLSVYHKENGALVFEQSYKFDGSIEQEVDLEIGIPKGCRKEYAKIIKLHSSLNEVNKLI
jgi:hypothetical protein